MIKKYKAKTDISINIVLPSGKSKHISFTSLTGGGSVYYTDSPDIQKSLESHYKFGKLFFADKTFEAEPAKPNMDNDVPSDVDSSDNGKTTVTVTDPDSAKAYLSERFGVSRTKLRTIAAIKEAAAANGIEFEGI